MFIQPVKINDEGEINDEGDKLSRVWVLTKMELFMNILLTVSYRSIS